MQYTMLVMRYDILTEEVKSELDQLAQASQILPERVLQATNNTRKKIKHLFSIIEISGRYKKNKTIMNMVRSMLNFINIVKIYQHSS